MTRKPDDVKKGLECCMDYQNCTEGEDPQCPYYDAQRCMEALLADALALIQQLQAENAEKDRKIQQLEATVSEKEKVVAELSGKIGQLEADNKLLQDAVDQWEFVAASPGAVEDMARENAELLKKVEQLQAERDAAVADMRQASIYLCCACKKYHHAVRGVSNHYCEVIGERADFTGAISCGMFEWRGVPKEDGNG